MSEQQKNVNTPEGNMLALRNGNDPQQIDLMELFFKLLVSWKFILCLAVICAILAGIYTTNYITPMYRATSVIYVLNPDSAINMSDLQLGTALTDDYIKLFSLWEVQEQVISNLNLPYSYGELKSMLSVSNSNNTRMLDITITFSDPEEAALIANEYANVARDYIAATMMTAKPTIMSNALVPSSPISPNKTGNIMKGFLLGAAVAAAIVVIRALLDDKYKTSEDIRRYTGLATLALIPKDEDAEDNSKKKTIKKVHNSGRRK